MAVKLPALLLACVLVVPLGEATRSSSISTDASVDLVFVTEDRAPWPPQNVSGCDAISVFDIASGRRLSAGDTVISPGRLALSPDQSLVLATQSNSPRFLYGMGALGG